MISCSSQGGVAGNSDVTQHLSSGGFVNSSVPGRTDRIPTSVQSDSYVIPADIISGLGQGNSLAGSHIMDMILKTGPYGATLPKMGDHANIPHPPKPISGETSVNDAASTFANGGASTHAPVVIAGGEFVVSPVDVMRIGGGSMKKGHEILDKFILNMRKHNIETQKKLSPPKK